jgi:acyl-coenzyme A thioesterase 9
MIEPGYLMRLAYEIGYSTAILFSGRTMRFLSLDSTTFKLPVPVGSILRLTSAVAHTIPGGESSEYSTLVVSMPTDCLQSLSDSTEFCRDCSSVGSPSFAFVFQNVRVQADVIDIKTGEEKNTNEFHFTWGVEGREPLPKTVVPVTYTGEFCFMSCLVQNWIIH